MNAREGMRRLGVAMGVAGGIVGTIRVFPLAQDVWKNHSAYHRLVESSAVVGVLKTAADCFRDRPVKPKPGEYTFDLRGCEAVGDSMAVSPVSDEIKRIIVNRVGVVSVIELSTGDSIQNTSLTAYAVLPLYPGMGILSGWGIIRVIMWISNGFGSK
jgi:hypothetical protein